MNRHVNKGMSLMAIAATALAIGQAAPAMAQQLQAQSFEGIQVIEVEPTVDSGRTRPILEAFDEAFYDNRGTYYYRISRPGYVQSLLFYYADQAMTDDSASLNVIYRDVLNRQLTSDPFIRTPDLKNIYESSLFTMPFFGQGAVGENPNAIEPEFVGSFR
jgi:hypothetical protein